ncbi:MAG: hypothetical protein IIZ39_02310, partial [Blautia sp.]|nr:hypothetical protein [Blautia sp.]
MPEIDDSDFGFSNDFLVEKAEGATDSLDILVATDSLLPEESLGEGDILVSEDLFETEAAEEAFSDGLVGEGEETGSFSRLQDMLQKVKDDPTAEKAVLYRDYVAEEGEPWLVIPEGMTTIDLNGHTISRDLKTATSQGAVIFVPSGSELTLIDSVGGGKVTGGNSSEPGGGILNEGTLTLGNSGQGPTISGNKGTDGGGIMNRGRLFLDDALLTDNTASENGGGLYLADSAEVHGGALNDNVAIGSGGGIYVGNGATLTLTGGTVTENTAESLGGGILVNAAEKSFLVEGNPVVI